MNKTKKIVSTMFKFSPLFCAVAIGSTFAVAQEVPDIVENFGEELTLKATVAPGVCALSMTDTVVEFGEIIPNGTQVIERSDKLTFDVNCQTKRRVAFQITDNNTSVSAPVNDSPTTYKFGDVSNREGQPVSIGHVEFGLSNMRGFHHYNSSDLASGVPLKFSPVADLSTTGSSYEGENAPVFKKDEYLVPYETASLQYQLPNGQNVEAGTVNQLASGTDFSGELDVNLFVRPNSELDISGDPVNLSATYTFTFAYL